MTGNPKGTIEIKTGDEAINEWNAMIDRIQNGETQLVDYGFYSDEGEDDVLREIFIMIKEVWDERGSKSDDPLGIASFMLGQYIGLIPEDYDDETA